VSWFPSVCLGQWFPKCGSRTPRGSWNAPGGSREDNP
jgi:hypothetical protein